ncbi:MAG: ATP-binding cassette domain-containing protein [Proteobacteria bacterium]|nr:ATP-binding cassette domain-containing protein [Pseudomonadota bacterium]MBU1582391.1 ATP-binding cassette domain-containing protein [Pseudomonadota bacterium]MBU2452175.1 ATP-binding cassette domain-containing protein [Pseudomonadota bacterium]MBU2627178.1 ATP-binding cassette domain-containing protein [Pseudomonadota bacterium]
MTTKEPAYHLNDIRHYYGDTKVLEIDTLKIEESSITGLIGPNGSGKTTLLKLLAFAVKPTRGIILYKGRPEVPFSPAIRSKVTLLTQKPYLLKRTVFENVAYGLKIRKDKNRLEERVKNALLTVGLDFQKFAPRKWHELSGGEAQRVAMAARLILKPEVLLLDEPIASVDTESAGLIRDASLKARENWGATLVIASHDLQWLYSISDRQLSIFNGNIFSTGMENIITGPFEQGDDKIVVKKLDDGQIITLTAPEKKTGIAVIRKKSISIDLEKQADQSFLNQLSGQIASMLLEKKTGHIMATIYIHDLSFVLRLTPGQISSLDLYPGKKVILKFQSTDVEWI